MSGEYTRNFDFTSNSTAQGKPAGEHCFPVFSLRKRANGADIEMVEIHTPGDRSQVFYGRVTDEHRARFSPVYFAWKNGTAAPVLGTPLENAPFIDVAFAHELRAMKITTVEQLRDLTDTQAQGIMGSFEWRGKAREWLAANSADPRDKAIADMAAQIAELSAKAAQPAPAAPPQDMAAMIAAAVAQALAGQKPAKAAKVPKVKKTKPATE